MNWFTNKVIVGNSVKLKTELAQEDSCCEHVEANPSLAYTMRREMDSFGVVAQHVCCQECEDMAINAEEEEVHTCTDCKCEFPLKEGILWKWYDFYAAQGDEPTPVCNQCRQKEKHLTRVRKDRADYEWEFPPYEEENEEEYEGPYEDDVSAEDDVLWNKYLEGSADFPNK